MTSLPNSLDPQLQVFGK